ncbi:hypothetical protein EB231_01525 [Mesorhizobium sp. NZP2298]|nr:hypothetical protein EB231_01525 [Mesorhizobium sp. NZP2298]
MIISLVAPRRREASRLSANHSTDISTWQLLRLCMRQLAGHRDLPALRLQPCNRQAGEWPIQVEKSTPALALNRP